VPPGPEARGFEPAESAVIPQAGGDDQPAVRRGRGDRLGEGIAPRGGIHQHHRFADELEPRGIEPLGHQLVTAPEEEEAGLGIHRRRAGDHQVHDLAGFGRADLDIETVRDSRERHE
jgi:hypothetical protein